jgi:hypothetical protein
VNKSQEIVRKANEIIKNNFFISYKLKSVLVN